MSPASKRDHLRGGGCPVVGLPFLDRLCPVEYHVGDLPLGPPSIQSFTVSPTTRS